MGRKKAPAPAPVNAPFTALQDWAAGQPHDLAFLTRDAAWSPTFSEQSFPAGIAEVHQLWSTGADLSWLGGPALRPSATSPAAAHSEAASSEAAWPRSSAGTALSHVITIALADAHRAGDAETKAGWPQHAEGLPTTGALEVFHDLSTFGTDPADGDSAAWLVRWLPEPDRSAFATEPDDLDTPGSVCQAGLFQPGWSTPSPEDLLHAPEEQFAAAEALTGEYRRAWMLQRALPSSEYLLPTTHLYGHSQHGTDLALTTLREALPLQSDDSHRLVLEVESWTHLNGWFGDAGTLQVWMRRSDLHARRFDAAWCMIRTD
ncbi:hypothetical protein GCM10027586_21100 [Kineococcus gypseus]|uniref:DUF1963 domain-containing protein n=1 Tax=Kineococcus gypseus TaxID=1637102 RepID=UPI003D7D2143